MAYSNPYTWMITYPDIFDEQIRKLTDSYFTTHPDVNNCYYELTAQEFFSFAGSKGINNTTINQLDRSNPNLTPHKLVIKWLVTCCQMLISQGLIGLNNDPVINDLWIYKYKMYRDDLKALSLKVNYEVIVSGLLQQNYTRAGNTFDIMI